MSSPARLLIIDANVLIDFLKADPSVLELASIHVGAVHVPRDLLREVEGLDAARCAELGLRVVEATLTQLAEAAAPQGRLSSADTLCLVLARDYGWRCVTNDKPLRKACETAGVEVCWGLELLLEVVRAGALQVDTAEEVARAIKASNRHITEQVLTAFLTKVRALTSRR
jgi:predicted nucleic acid-binding protein